MSIDIPTQSSPVSLANPAASESVSSLRSRSGTWMILGGVVVGLITMITLAASGMLNRVGQTNSIGVMTHSVSRGDLVVSVTEDGTLESSNNVEIKCKVKGGSTVLWVVESGTNVKPGDELVRLDTSTIEDNINQQKITYQTALATYAQSESNVAVAEISITEYLEGTFRTELKTAQSNVAISEENLRVAQNTLAHAEKMFRKGYVSELELDGNQYSVQHAVLELELMKTQVDALEKFTKPKMLKELRSTLKAAEAKLASDKAALDLEKARLDRAEQQLKNCVIKAKSAGMVIYPSAAEWKEQPDIEEGANVREDQVLLIMPDLDNMQVKVGIHESKVDRLKVGMPCEIELQDAKLDGEVLSVASITRPAGWWTGNAVKYDTIIKLESRDGLKPGMSAAVEIFLATHRDVLKIPVAAVLELQDGFHCWVENGQGIQQRKLELGDSNGQFIVAKSGLKDGDRVVLNPLAFVEEAQLKALKPIVASKAKSNDAKSETKNGKGVSTKGSKTGKSKQGAKQVTGAAIIKYADKNGDGVLTKDEFSDKDRENFDKTDLNGNGEVDASEIDAALKKAKSAAAKK